MNFSKAADGAHGVGAGDDGAGAASLTPAIAYAVERCGFLVTRDTRRVFTSKELARWDAAVAEYADRLMTRMLEQRSHEVARSGR